MLLERFLRDVRYALRGMRRSPGFAVVAVATLALAIGANTAIFSVVDALLMRALPYRNADRLVVIAATREITGATRALNQSFQLDAAARWQRSLRTLDEVAYYDTAGLELETRGGAEMLRAALVSPSFFSVLGGAMAAGVPISPGNALTASVVISERLANRLFGGPGQAVGQSLTLNARAYTIVGVAGSGWDVPSDKTDLWDSATFAGTINPRCCGVRLIGRLKAGVSVAQADGDVRETAERLASVDPASFGRLHMTVTTLRSEQLGSGRTVLLLLWAAVGVVLVIACANLLNLLVARNASRMRDIVIRQTLGAPRARLVLQGLTESAVLVAAGVAGGLLIARAATAMLAGVDPDMFPQLHDVHLDRTVLAFAIALGILTMIATGIAPSLQASRAAAPRTHSVTPTRRHRRLQQILCAAQLAAAVVLLVSAALLGRSLVDLLGTDLGVSPDHVLTASLYATAGRPHTAQELASTLDRVVDRVQHLPGVESAGASTSLPPNDSNLMISLKPAGGNVSYVASAVSCTPGYFHALGMRLVEGRFFRADDDGRHPPVIIVSQTTARHLFPGKDPVGQTFHIPKFPYAQTSSNEATVVGVVSDVKYSGIDASAGDQVYWSLPQAPWLSTFLTVRAANDAHLAPALRAAVASVDPTFAITSIQPLESILATATAPARFRTALIAAFALLALVIAAVGLYGIVAYSVSERTAEIGVRVALGAATRDVISIVLREALAMAGAGLVIGLPLAYVTARTFAALLFGVTPADVFTYAASAVALLLVALAAALVPAQRAARVDPIMALRAE
jgi:putative ABC transport system permease protein